MKKAITLLMAAIMLFATAALLTGCGSSNPLVGTWELTEGNWSDRMIFERNGNGRIEEWYHGELDWSGTFTWSSDNGSVTVVLEGNTMVFDYSISGRRLTFDDEVWTRR